MVPISSECMGLNNASSAKGRRRVRKRKVNVRCYTSSKTFSRQKDFNDWLTKETEKIPWYLCSSYKAGNIFKRVYTCSYRKRLGFKKCERQLMVLFYPNGSVEVMDSGNDSEHLHCPISKNLELGQLRTVIVLRSPDEFASWLAKQREKFAWHRRAGRRLLPNIDYYQCTNIDSNGKMCKRLIHVEYTNQNGVIVSELEGLPPHDSTSAHKNLFNQPCNSNRESKNNTALDALPSTSAVKDCSEVAPFTISSNLASTSEFVDVLGRKAIEGNKNEKNTAEKATKLPSIEDFVIIPDDECDLDDSNVNIKTERDTEHTSSLCKPSSNPSIALFSGKNNGSSSTQDSDCQINDNIRIKEDANLQVSTMDEKDSKYNLNNFAQELANKLSKAPLERMAEIRESLRREMDEVFARQIVREIISRSYSSDACKEVLDRIRGVLRQY